MMLGPVMLDLAGTTLGPEEREILRHPLVGGVIFFTRNYESPEQIRAFANEIHQLRDPPLLIAVDHEGGRVQRFRSGFTALPPAGTLGVLHEENPLRARRLAERLGWLMATELRAVGVDFSFAPVLDLNAGVSTVIGNRAFHTQPETVAILAHAYMNGMREAGMSATGKHFPGHGHVAADSHLELPVDDRPFEEIWAHDVLPFARMIEYGLAAVMPAHVVYRRVDPRPAGYSHFWLQNVLRGRLGFEGVIFSDDLTMAGAGEAGGMVARAEAALEAGCDVALVCNNPAGAIEILDGLKRRPEPVATLRLARLHGRHGATTGAGLAGLTGDARWLEAVETAHQLA